MQALVAETESPVKKKVLKGQHAHLYILGQSQAVKYGTELMLVIAE